MKEFILKLKKLLLDRVIAYCLVICLVALYLILNTKISDFKLKQFDFTSQKIYTLSESSKDIVRNIDKEVQIYLVGYTKEAPIANLLNDYGRANSNIQYEIASYTDNPDLASKYGITADSVLVIIESGDNSKVLSDYDMYSYDYNTYDTYDVTEEKITNGIIDVTIEEKPYIYFLIGHDEYNVSQNMILFPTLLVNEANEVNILDLLVSGSVPEDCNLLVIPSPVKDMTEYESGLILDYINKGGNILFLQDVNFEGTDFVNMQKVLDMFGVSIRTGIILEENSDNTILSTPHYIIPYLSTSSEISSKIASSGAKIIFPNSCALELPDYDKQVDLSLTIQDIANSSDTSFLRTNLTNNSKDKLEEDIAGPLTLGAEITKEIDAENNIASTLVIYSNCVFASDTGIQVGQNTEYAISLGGNKDLVLNTVAYLTEREDTITIRKNTGTVTYTATDKQHTIVQAVIFAFPALIILAGIIVWQKRRRKK